MANPAAKLSELPPLPNMNQIYTETWTFPAGTEVFSMNPQHCGAARKLGRTMHVVPRFVDKYPLRPPYSAITVGWAGSGGYWQRVHIPITPEDGDV